MPDLWTLRACPSSSLETEWNVIYRMSFYSASIASQTDDIKSPRICLMHIAVAG
jgi:hypothetical protein